MAERETDLQLGELAESLALLRGQSRNFVRDREMQSVAERQADPLEKAIFDSLNNLVRSARADKFSMPGGPNETGMRGRRFPMHALEREPDPMQEILRFKAEELDRQFRAKRVQRALTRHDQRVNEIRAKRGK